MTSRTAVRIAAITLAAAVAACEPTPLPEAGSPEADLYAKACGKCHAPIPPSRMTGAMWDLQLERMVDRVVPALSAAQRTRIRDYLHRHAR